MHSTSGCAYWSQSSTRGRRALSEFTFQVAKRTALRNLPDVVSQVVGVRDHELRPHGLPHGRRHLVAAVVERPVPDAGGELGGQRGDVGVMAEQRGEPSALGGVEIGAEPELALEHPERVDRDARVELHPALHRGHHVVGEELADRLEELAGGRSILHHVRPSISSSRSHSISATRRPRVASSTERTAPCRCVNAWISHITPHLSVPSASQYRSSAGSTARPPVDRYAASRSSTDPKPPTRWSVTPKRQDFTHSQPRSSTGSPRCASSQSSTARMPSAPTTKLPLRKSPCTSVGRAASGGACSASQRRPSSNAGWGSPKPSRYPR